MWSASSRRVPKPVPNPAGPWARGRAGSRRRERGGTLSPGGGHRPAVARLLCRKVPQDVDAPAVVLALVLAETAVGGLVLLWFAPTWGNVRHGYEVLLSSTLALMAWGAWASLNGPLAGVAASGGEAAGAAPWAGRALAATAVLAALAAVVLLVRLPPLVGRLLGIAATLAGLASFVPLALVREARNAGAVPLGVLELLLGAFLLGAIWDGMVLGHWYLVERRLSNRYMVWMAWANVGAVVAGLGAVALSAANPVPCAGLSGAELAGCTLSFSPLLGVGSMTLMIGFGVVALIAVITYFNVRLAREGGKSIQASTGMFYLAVILAPAAEFASKIRFF